MSESAHVAELLRQGIAAVKAGRKEEARRLLMQVVELDEQNEQAWLWLSGVVETVEDRRICLENVLTINPNNAHAQAGLAWIAQNAPPESTAPAQEPTTEEPPVETPSTEDQTAASADGRCPRCRAPLTSSARVCPECKLPLIITCPACGQYADVENTVCPSCGHRLGDFRQGAAYHLALAQSYMDGGQKDYALEALARAQAEQPDDPQQWAQIAHLYEQAGRLDQALAAAERAVQIAPDDADLLAHLGVLYRQKGQIDRALDTFQKAMELDAENPTAVIGYARIKEEQGKTAEVMTLLDRLVGQQPMTALGSLLLADLYLSQKRPRQARKFYAHACQLSSPDSEVGREALRRLAELEGKEQISPDEVGEAPIKRAVGGKGERPGCVTAYAVLLGSGGLFAVASTLALAALSGGLQRFLAELEAQMPGSMGVGPSVLGTALWAGVAFAFIGAAVNITVAIGLWNMKNWARVAVIALQGLGLLLGACQSVTFILSFRQAAAAQGFSGGFPIFSLVWLLVWFAIQGYILFWFAANRDAFH